MGQRGKFGVGAVVGLGLLIASTGIAHAAGDTFTVDKTSARRGETILLTSSTPCTLPSGVTGTPIVRVALERDAAVLARVSVSPGADGMWRASLIVGHSTAPGHARVTATCVASAQAEGALVVYDPVDVTVTAELAMTGAHTTPLAATGFGVLLSGLALAAAAGVTRRDGRSCSSPSR